MKKILVFFILLLSLESANAQNVNMSRVDSLEHTCILTQNRLDQHGDSILVLKDQYLELIMKVNGLETKLLNLSHQNLKTNSTLDKIYANVGSLNLSLDSLYSLYRILSNKQRCDNDQLLSKVDTTKKDIEVNTIVISKRTSWGIACLCILLLIIIAIFVLFKRKVKKESDSIEEVRNTQKMLVTAQLAIQEESLKLDNKLLEVVEKQLSSSESLTKQNGEYFELDHSLALKIADEIVRIESNLSHMDSTVKGYKQLTKAVERIKNNFAANGYDIVDMLGKPYAQGMKAAVSFVTDENLEPGVQIISKIIKPQVNFKHEMIQAAQIEVSQSE